MTHGFARIAGILASATLFAAAAGIEQPSALLVWIALVPWLASLDRAGGMRGTVLSAVVMTCAFVVVVFAWFGQAVAHYTGTSPLLTGALLILTAPLLQPQFIAFALLRHLLIVRGAGRLVVALGAAFAWVGCEWLCPRLFGDSLGHGLYAFATLRQGADIAGVVGLTFVIVLTNQAAYEAIRSLRGSHRRAFVAFAAAAALVGTLTAYGAWRLDRITEAETVGAPLRAALVQANLADYDGLRERLGTFEAVRSILDAHEALSRRAVRDEVAPFELLLWPETVYPTTFGNPKSPEGAAFDREIVAFAGSLGMEGVPLLFGTYDRDGVREFNAAVFVSSQRSGDAAIATYRKRRLFPFTEYVPAWLDTAFLRERFTWMGTWQPGQYARLFELERADGTVVRIAPLICLDAVDPGLAVQAAADGADLIVTLSNDGWFAGGPGAMLHLVVSAFRSIETRLPQLRATNTGISAVISPTGEIVASTAVGIETVLEGTVTPGRRGRTLVVLWGDWFGPFAALAAVLLTLVALARRR